MSDSLDLIERKEAAEPRLFKLPNVNLVGLGTKVTNGVDTGVPAIVVFVATKVPLDQLPQDALVPREINGLPTDVVEIGRFDHAAGDPDADLPEDLKTYRPRLGGARISWIETERLPGLIHETKHKGTLGCIVRTTDAQPIDAILTNQHVVSKTSAETSEAARGREIGQPDTEPCSDCCPCCNHIIGRVLRTKYTPDSDAALVALDPGTKWRAEVIDIGPITGSFDVSAKAVPDLAAAGLKGMSVHKRGMKTRLRHGQLMFNNVSGPFPSPPKPMERMMKDQLLVTPIVEGGVLRRFCIPGDSGSVVLDDQRRVIGLLFAGNDATNPAAAGYGQSLLSPIARVTEDLAAQLVSAPAGQEFKAPAYNYRETPTAHEARALAPAMSDAEAQRVRDGLDALERSSTGRKYLDLVDRHQGEVRALVNGNRRVAARWHRLGGPTLLHNALASARTGAPIIPTEVDGRPIEEAIQGIVAMFRRYGSVELIRDLDAYQARLPELSGLTLDELLDRVTAGTV